MAAFWFKAIMFVMILQATMNLFSMPQFNIFDKHYSNPNMYFNKTNMTEEVLTQSQADMLYMRNSNMTSSSIMNVSGNFGNLISDWNETNIAGVLVNVLLLSLGMVILLIQSFIACYTFTYTFITSRIGMEYAPIAIIIQGALDIAYTYTGLQVIAKVSDKLLNS